MGEMTSKTTPNGSTVSYTPNTFGKNNKVTYDGNTILYEYNTLGLVTKMTDSTGVTNYTYDRFGRLTKEEKNGILKSYTYDDNSNITKFALSSGGAEKLNISYGYDALNRLTGVTDGLNAAAYAYDKNSNVISLSMGNKINNTYAYNKANLLTAQTDSVLGKTYALSYNVDGNISSITETGKPSKTYTYDNTGKLVSETSEGKYTADYTFDNRQNRITKAYTDLADGGNNAVINYTYNLKNQLVSEQKTCGSKLDITDYEYDFNGNLYTKTHREYDENPNAEPQLEISQTPSGIERYTFNALDMPVSANINGIETTYTYDGNNLRTSKTSGGTTTEFLYDGVNVIGEKTNTDVKTYIRGKEILLDSDGIFYHHDTHGSVSALVNAQNEVLAQNIYDAYGAGNISHLSPFGYCGEYFDSETGFVYLRNRYYDPNTGRFISQDPIKDGDNWYVYANNNPIMFFDPFGLAPTTKEAAEMADHIYHWDQNNDKKDRIVSGWRLIDVWWGRESMKMGIYIRNSDDWENPSEYVIVFKGTDNLQNWVNNAEAYLSSKSADMWDAINYSKGFVGSHSQEITFVGHSKGGGEAIAAATATNKNAITFNAANFNFSKYGLTEANKSGIKNYYVDGEVLSAAIGYARFGTTQPLLPTQYWTVDWSIFGREIKIPAPIKNHYMDAVKRAL